ncbi:MAG: hypothetical protein AB1806_15715 [Acidobacteriota bacterium]
MTKTFGPLVIALCTTVACQDLGQSPASPSGTPPSAQEVALQWSPYVGVHADGRALTAYEDALSALRRAGRLNGVRMEIQRNELVNPVIKAVGALGLEVLGLVSNEYLFEPDIEGAIDGIFSAYPEIRYFQIGNEVTTILPPGGQTMTIEEYAAVFQRVYEHVEARHPKRAILLTQSALGSGLRGPTELETLTGLALSRMDPDRVIVAINAYDPDAVSQHRGLLGGALRSFRVWVTESGMANPDRHASYVRDKYPLLRQFLRAERVYWYVMWGGDEGPDANFSLIKYPASHPNYWKSPLFDLLAEGR